MKTNIKFIYFITLSFVMVMSIIIIGSTMSAADTVQVTQSAKLYDIANPYKNVDWASYGQYKASFHAHSTNSDGVNLTRDMVEAHYVKGYDILAMTDHNYITAGWDKVNLGPISPERKAEIEAGIGRNGRGMIGIENGNEQSDTDHINSFFAPYNNVPGATMASTIAAVEAMGGITHINHPGLNTGGHNSNDEASKAASNNPATVKKYVDLFMSYRSCIGMEIVNAFDDVSKSDRILWDNILKQTMPEDRPVWGFSNDDAHGINAIGYSWNVMLMPTLSQIEARKAMETGAFYAVSRISRLDGINRPFSIGSDILSGRGYYILYSLEQPIPSISNIDVNGNTIAITGSDYDLIDWVADGVIIATGVSIDLSNYSDSINSYVRAQLKSKAGIAYTQPFGVKEKGTEIKPEYPILDIFKERKLPVNAIETESGIEYMTLFTDRGVLLSNSMLDGWSVIKVTPQIGKGWKAGIYIGEIVVTFLGEVFDETVIVQIADNLTSEIKELEIIFSGEKRAFLSIEETTNTERKGSSGGCNAVTTILALLAVVPVFRRRK